MRLDEKKNHKLFTIPGISEWYNLMVHFSKSFEKKNTEQCIGPCPLQQFINVSVLFFFRNTSNIYKSS